jgi:hypothetical protein
MLFFKFRNISIDNLGPIPNDVQWNQNNQVIFKISLLIDHNRDHRTIHAIQAALKTKQPTAANMTISMNWKYNL